ncbi:MAG: propanoyl-CoA acyltransferase [Spirochaetales bacterium]|nr:MAG: propanoyl-CoA acyltransferase [Spirochaetales bacterium]
MSKVSIIGAYNTKFGSFVKKNRETKEITDLKSIDELTFEAVQGALKDAGVEGKDVDGLWLGSCAPGLFANQEHMAALAISADPGLRYKMGTRCEDACASSSVALYDAIYAVESGRCKVALVVGVEKMNLLPTKGVTHALATCSHWASEGVNGMTFPGLFAEYAKGYMAHYGMSEDELRKMLAYVSALGYKNGVDNPLAHFGVGGPSDKLQLFTADAILNLPDDKNPIIAEPLRLHDCSLVTDGAAAMVITSTDNAKAISKRVVEIAGIGHVNELIAIKDRDNMYEMVAGKKAKDKAFKEAGISIKDVDLAEVHDCFTINQLLCTEALGLSEDGKAGYDYMDGKFTRDDACPVNISGGLKAKGHPVGATGASMHTLVYKQLVGEPIGAKPSKGQPEVGVTLNVGGSSATNCVSVLRRLK